MKLVLTVASPLVAIAIGWASWVSVKIWDQDRKLSDEIRTHEQIEGHSVMVERVQRLATRLDAMADISKEFEGIREELRKMNQAVERNLRETAKAN